MPAFHKQILRSSGSLTHPSNYRDYGKKYVIEIIQKIRTWTMIKYTQMPLGMSFELEKDLSL